MADRDYVALDWVKKEIEETLKQAQQSLEAYVENSEDTTRIRFCLTYIHQVHGTLQMVEFAGAALLAEEMEKLAQSLMNDKVSNTEEAQEVLMTAILQLPPYLERIKQNHRDQPVTLLPLLNDLRAARGENLLTDSALFTPDLSAASDSSKEVVAVDEVSFDGVVRKLRQMYQYALIGLIRGEDLPANLGYLAKVFARLEKMSENTPLGQLWWICSGVIESLANGSLKTSASIESLLRLVDKELRRVVAEGQSANQQPAPDDLLKNLLYYIAKDSADSPRIRGIRTTYSLEDALPDVEELDMGNLGGPDQEAISSVVKALTEEISAIKDTLDLFVRSEDKNITRLEEMVTPLKQVSDTMTVLGLDTPRKVIHEQMDIINGIIESGDKPSDTALMDAAGALLYVEETLLGMTTEGGLRSGNAESPMANRLDEAQRAVIREAHSDLEQIKAAITEFIAAQWDHSQLEQVPQLFARVRGGLSIIPLPRATDLLVTCSHYIENIVKEQAVPQWQSLDSLADTISSVEYYLERLIDDSSADDSILDVAEESAQKLDIDASEEQVSSVDEVPVHETDGTINDDLISDDMDLESVEDVSTIDFDASTLSLLPEQKDEDAQEEKKIGPVLSNISITVSPKVILTEIPTEDLATLAEVDDELIEIFTEEAEEVQEAINEYLPIWKADLEHSDQELTDLRRSFHTLKGSGRVVGALVIGELGWAIENMLNRIIDHTIEPKESVFEVIDQVLAVLPSMLALFSQRKQCDIDVSAIMARADAISQNLDDETVKSEKTSAINKEVAIDIIDPLLLDIFRNEAESHINDIEVFIEDAVDSGEPMIVSDGLQRALHTLKGSAHMAALTSIAAIVTPVESLIKQIQAQFIPADESVVKILKEAVVLIKLGISRLEIGTNTALAGADDFLQRLDKLHNEVLNSNGLTPTTSGDSTEIDVHMGPMFLTEAMDILLDVSDLLDHWAKNPVPGEDLNEMLRELRTLEQGSEVVGLSPVKDLSAALERAYQAVLEGNYKPDDAFFVLVRRSHESLIEMMDTVAMGQNVMREEALVNELNLLSGFDLSSFEISDDDELDIQNILSGELEELADISEGLSIVDEEASNIDHSLMDIFLEEASDVMASMATSLQRWLDDTNNLIELAEMQRDMHTLEGGARLIEANEIRDLCCAMENLYEALSDGRLSINADLFELLHEGQGRLTGMLNVLRSSQPCSSADDLIARIQAYKDNPDSLLDEPVVIELTPYEAGEDNSESIADVDGDIVTGDSGVSGIDVSDLDEEIIEIFLEEAQELHESMERVIGQWINDSSNSAEYLGELLRHLHTLKGGARLSGITPLGDLTHDFETFLEKSQYGTDFDGAFFDKVHQQQDQLTGFIDAMSGGMNGLVAYANQLGNTTGSVDSVATETVPLDLPAEQLSPESSTEGQAEDKAKTYSADDLDEDVIEIFQEEAQELQDAIDECLGHWIKDRANAEYYNVLLRHLHTLKGGARLSGITPLADLTHNYETFLEKSEGATNFNDKFFEGIQQWQDQLVLFVEAMNGGMNSLLAYLNKSSANKSSANAESPKLVQSSADDDNTNVVQFRKEKEVEPEANKNIAVPPPSGPQSAPQAAARKQPQEAVKVSADLLENLVNLAGETSISRGRIEQQVNNFGFTLEEMESTIERVRGQLRRLDIETEAQILFRQEKTQESDYEDFDPLEMDRFSQLQTLSRSLLEGASDLLDLKDTLSNNTRDTETLLVQQQRANTELQEGLMRTRMVPFSRLTPRLRRVVRQVGSELGKKVDFEVLNDEGELDRTVLERMVAPLEHMLRNSMDHGIENADARKISGKPETGKIQIRLGRDGGDVVIEISDDGGGIDVDAVRAKALERGLISSEAETTDDEVLQFILSAGFSTAKQVTQLSGRGVGMDVVHSEVKQLGGNMSINSTKGVGTQFVIRLPFTVSVNRALMVRIAEDLYAIPLNTIEGVVRVSPYELETYYQDDAPAFEYAGEPYKIQYLGSMLKGVKRASTHGQTTPLPVILLRGADQQSAALQVDALLGSREIVVKTLGPQFSTVPGLSGATILGDGNVVIILDLNGMVRSSDVAVHSLDASIQALETDNSEEQDAYRPIKVMVVDDSVTVRKVTTRLLERYGMEVVTAKDGVDAITVLQDNEPDVMLLDIEMPRMDGFEFANHVRHDELKKDLPIIMITSRTGEKHRERAMSIGVNEYLGKPFQEDLLLDTISKLVGVNVKG